MIDAVPNSAALAQKLGTARYHRACDVKAFQRSSRMTLEEAAREVRYSFLADVCEEIGTDIIATGHTQNDNTETILLHIVRGSGTRGLVGLKPLTPRTIDGLELLIVRPMLDITREETVGYCQSAGLEPRVDTSNFELSPLRNKIRLKLLPLLREYNPNINGALLRLSASAADEMDYLDEQAAALLDSAAKKEGDVIILDREALINVHPALKRHLLRACMEQLPGGLKDIEYAHIVTCCPCWTSLPAPYRPAVRMVFMAGYDSTGLAKKPNFRVLFPLSMASIR
jgi:tRNA(Ile)-lysidine synthase